MRQDASTIEQQMNHPADLETIGGGYSAYGDVARACEKWLKKRFPNYVPGFRQANGMYQNRNKAEINAKPASTEKGAVHIPREKKKRVRKSRAKFSTKEERMAHFNEKIRAYWQRPDVIEAMKKKAEEKSKISIDKLRERARRMARERYARRDPVVMSQQRKLKRARQKERAKAASKLGNAVQLANEIKQIKTNE